MLPEKKILVRSFSKGNLIQPTKTTNNQIIKKNEKNTNGFYFQKIFSIFLK